MIERQREGSVTVLRLAHGKVNALDIELLRRLSMTLDEEASGDARAVVFTGAGSCLSAGVDLTRVLDGGAEYVREFIPVLEGCFDRMAGFPKPLVVAANGHALAGGCVMLSTGDWRIAAETDAKIGLTELPVGVPFPGIALEISRAAIPRQYQRQLIYRGTVLPLRDARNWGLCDEVCPPDTLMDRALEVAGELGAVPPETFHAMKEAMTRELRRKAREHPHVTELWASPQVLGAIGRFVERTLSR